MGRFPLILVWGPGAMEHFNRDVQTEVTSSEMNGCRGPHCDGGKNVSNSNIPINRVCLSVELGEME